MMCFAPTCKHYTEKHACTYFVFPKDTQEFKKWVKLIRRKDREPSKHSRICSCHFVDEDRKNGPTIFNYNVGKQFEPVEVKSRKKGQRRNKQQKLNAIPPVIQEQETSEPPFDIKQEITIDEPVLEDYIHFPKLETFENSSTEISYEQDPLLEVEIQVPQETDNISSSTSSNSFTKRRKVENYINFPKLEPLENSSAGTGYEQNPLLEVEIQAPQEMDNISSSASSKSFTKGRKVDYINFPKLETLENSSTGTGYEQNPLSEVEIEASQEMENISSNTSSKSFTKRRKVIENDIGVEEGHDVLDTVQVKLENEDDHVDYGMYIASRLQNANQSDRAIAMAKQKIELILSDLEMGIFEMSLH